MKNHLSHLSLFALAASLATPALAATEVPNIVITANRVATQKTQLGSSVTVLTSKELEDKGYTQVFDALKEVPGVSISRNGGIGGTAQIRLRGSNPGQVKVLVDGVAVNDPGNANSEYDFNSLMTGDIERIEVIRGPQSALYGSDAMGGVINIITKQGAGKPKLTASTEAGSYRTFKQAASVSGKEQAVDYRFTVQRLDTQGFSRVPVAPQEKDGAHNTSLSGKLGYDINPDARVEFSGGYTNLSLDFDPSPTADGPAQQYKKVYYGKTSGSLWTLDRKLENIVNLQASRTERDFSEPNSATSRYSSFDGNEASIEYQGNYHLRTRDVLTGGVSYGMQDALNSSRNSTNVLTTSFDKDVDLVGLYGQYLWGIGENTTLTTGVRRDDHSQFGSDGTYRVTGVHSFKELGTSVHASYGTGLKNPSLFQLYSSANGNANLQPEESRGFDFGVDQSLLAGKLELGSTAFRNDYKNLIEFDTVSSRYRNVSKANTKGLENTAKLHILPNLTGTLGYTYMLAENEATHRELQRRPKNVFTAGIDYSPNSKWNLGTFTRYASAQRDSDSLTIARTGRAYTVTDVYGSYEFIDNAQVYARLENAFDRDYQETARYNSPGRGIYAGLRASY